MVLLPTKFALILASGMLVGWVWAKIVVRYQMPRWMLFLGGAALGWGVGSTIGHYVL